MQSINMAGLNGFIISFTLVSLFFCTTFAHFKGIERIKCDSRIGLPFRPHSDQRHRVTAVLDEMKKRTSIHGTKIDAYIVTTWDEHLNEYVSDHDKRTQYISGFTGRVAHVVITMTSVALWTDEKFLNQANAELNCDWKIFSMNQGPSITAYLISELDTYARVGVDPRTVPHKVWLEWDSELQLKFIKLIKVNENFIDKVWIDRPHENHAIIKVHPLEHAGEKWESKFKKLRKKLTQDSCDAMIVTSLTEIAYLLNLRGTEIPYTPVFKAYLLVTLSEAFLYIDKSKVDLGIILHLNTEPCASECVRIKDYNDVWNDLRTNSHYWRKILVPGHCVFDLGVSEAIYSNILPGAILERPSPVIFMRAQKNPTEQKGMRRAQVLDGVAMCDAFSLLERRIRNEEAVSEVSAAADVDRSRYGIMSNRGLSLKTMVAFGPHSSVPHFDTVPETDILILDNSTCIIDSGGQYIEGTAEVTRTLHYGVPTFEQKQMYTNVLRAIIRLSTLVFPENLKPAEVDALARSSVWDSHNDYPSSSGHGIGSYLSVIESPIKISYTEPNEFSFEENNFFANEPGLYQKGRFGVKLENVLEVYDTGERHPSGARFLGFRDVTYVPFEPNLIDRGLLSMQEKKWLNQYNARIRTEVGDELKAQFNMQAFYWMMNKTMHVIEYYPESEYRQRGDATNATMPSIWIWLAALFQIVGQIR